MKKIWIIGIIRRSAIQIVVALTTVVVVVSIVVVIVINSGTDENIAILEAGNKSVPIINSEDLDHLGRVYAILNETFEREIDELTLGNTNRHNLSDNRINALTHYGIYGQDNPSRFKNDEYRNGIRITYEKDNTSIADGASNFNDIIAVMAILYDQQMDMIPIDKLEETFTKLFWLSHTYTYESDELYPCRYGCSAVDKYKCVDVYNDYKGSNLKYHPFTVPPHELYIDAGFESDEDFIKQFPERMCEVCGKRGAGCIWEENKVCYHGSGNISFSNYNDKKYEIIVNDDDEEEKKFEGPIYADLGSVVIPEYEDEKYLGPKPIIPTGENDGESAEEGATSGHKVDKSSISCNYYMEVKYCSERARISRLIAQKKKSIYEYNKKIDKENNKDNPNSNSIDSWEEYITECEDRISELEEELSKHITDECEVNEEKAKYWCDGFKLCLGHKTHYRCGGHKIIVCYGHTSINVTVKILYRDKLLEQLYAIMG